MPRPTHGSPRPRRDSRAFAERYRAHRKAVWITAAAAAVGAMVVAATGLATAAPASKAASTASAAPATTTSTATSAAATTWISYTDGKLVYGTDSKGNRLPDFSYAGYDDGNAAIPTAPVEVTLKPQSSGDDTARIQAAIDKVSALPLASDGLRGAVYLSAGTYRVGGALTISASGVVLRGAGDGSGGTELIASGTPRALVTFAGSGSIKRSGSAVDVTDTYVPIGATSFHVSSTAGLHVGESIVVQRPQTQTWIDTLGMNDITNATAGDPAEHWNPNSGLEFERTIKAISGDEITVDIPLTNALEKQYTQALVWPYTFAGRITNVGVEDFSADGLGFTTAADYDTSGYFEASFSTFSAVDGGWARNIVARRFGSGMGSINANSEQVTWQNTAALEMQQAIPQAIHAQPAAYTISGQQNLVLGCQVSGSNLHAFTTEANTAGPNVFSDCTATQLGGRRFDAGPHQRWDSGTLYDDITMAKGTGGTWDTELDVYNRYNAGSGQGWAGAANVLWNTTSDLYSVQSPPTSYNWAFGVHGAVEKPLVAGYPGQIVSAGTSMQPASLYAAQLSQRK